MRSQSRASLFQIAMALGVVSATLAWPTNVAVAQPTARGLSAQFSFPKTHFGPGIPFEVTASVTNASSNESGTLLATVAIYRRALSRPQLERALEKPQGAELIVKTLSFPSVGVATTAPLNLSIDFSLDPAFQSMRSGVYPVTISIDTAQQVSAKPISAKPISGSKTTFGAVYLNEVVETPLDIVLVAQFAPPPLLSPLEHNTDSASFPSLEIPLHPNTLSAVSPVVLKQLEFLAQTNDEARQTVAQLNRWKLATKPAREPSTNVGLVDISGAKYRQLFEDSSGDVLVPPGLVIDEAASQFVSRTDVCCALIGSELFSGSNVFTVSTPATSEGVLLIPTDRELSQQASIARSPVSLQNLLARTAMLFFERPGTHRVVGMVVDGAAVSAGAISTLLAGAPWLSLGSLPGEAGDAVVDLNIDSVANESIFSAQRSVSESVNRLKRWTLEGNQLVERLELISEALNGTAWFTHEPGTAADLAAGVSRAIAQAQNNVSASESGGVTFTSQEGRIPITILNNNDFPVRLKIELSSGQLSFPEGASRELEIAPPGKSLTIPAIAESSGTFVLTVSLKSPDGIVLVDRAELPITSTAANRLAVGVTVLAFFVLVGGYTRRRRSRARGASQADARAAVAEPQQ